MSRQELVHIVVPAAGMATRLAQGGVSEHKPLLQVDGESTILSRILAAAGRVPANVDLAVPVGSTARFIDSVGQPLLGWHECEPIGFLATVRLLLRVVPSNRKVVVVLGDDVTADIDFLDVLAPVVRGAWASQLVANESDMAAMQRACQVWSTGSRMTEIVEKPKHPTPGWRGCGVFGLSPRAADEIRHGRLSHLPGLSEVYAQWICDGHRIETVETRFNVNVNTIDDLDLARRELLALREGTSAAVADRIP